MKKHINDYLLITIGSALYAVATVLFIFPHLLLLGGTSGISVILSNFIDFSPAKIVMAINFLLLVLAFVFLGKSAGVKTFVGSTLTTLFVGVAEKVFMSVNILVPGMLLSVIAGAVIIAIASGIMFYVDASSGGTDIIALIIKKYFKINVGKALLITDFLIVVVGGVISGISLAICSLVGLLIKTLGIDFVISVIKRLKK